jgi:hypothetical protein
VRCRVGAFDKFTIQKLLIVGRGFFVVVARGLVTVAKFAVAVVRVPVLFVEDLVADMHERCWWPDLEGF